MSAPDRGIRKSGVPIRGPWHRTLAYRLPGPAWASERPERFLFVRQVLVLVSVEARERRVVGAAGRRVLALGRVREWFFRSAGCWGWRPVTLDSRAVPACPPGRMFTASWSSCR